MPIEPDTKDWTWVLQRPCPECGLDLSTVAATQVADRLADNAVAWQAVLAGPPDVVRARPSDSVWSPLEYACHVRDVFRVFDARFRLVAEEDDPLFANWDQDATAVEDHYDEQDPAVVSTELRESAEALVTTLRAIDGDGWSRPGRRSDGAAFTAATMALYLLHDPVHHLHDVGGAQ
jgi:hypothetical protein